jgi:dienelactone hydrolase
MLRRVGVLAIVVLAAACTGASDGTPPVETGSPPSSPSAAPSQSLDTTAVDAAIADGPYDTALRTYRLDDITVPSGTVPVEVQGRVVGPVGTGASDALPLVVLLHGYNGSCWDPRSSDTSTDWPCPTGWKPIPSDAGFDYLQQRLASQGYLTVSLSANGVNVAATQMDDDAGAQARSVLVRRHLQAWSNGEVALDDVWPQVDMTRVLLVGHSRGGEGVDRAAAESADEQAWRVAGTVLLGPTAFEPPRRTVVPLVTVTGYCDGDVGPGPAQRLVDRPADDGLLRTAVIVMGANHNFFNSEWTPGESTVPGGADDAYLEDGSITRLCDPTRGDRISPAQQRDVAQRVVGLAAAALLHDDPAALSALDGRLSGTWADADLVRLSALGNGRVTWVPGDNLRPQSTGDLTAALCRGVSETTDERACGFGSNEGIAVHWPDEYRGTSSRQAAALDWVGDGSVALGLPAPVDLSDAVGVEARIAVAPGTPPVSFEVELTDASGRTQVIGTSDPVEPFPDDPMLPSRLWGQRVFVPLPPSAGVDLNQVTSLTFTPSTQSGRAWVVDVSAVSASASP